jgi:hypothetical protein
VERCQFGGDLGVGRLAETTQPAGTEFALGIEARSRGLLSDGAAADHLYCETIERLGRTQLRPELARAHPLYGEWLRREGRTRRSMPPSKRSRRVTSLSPSSSPGNPVDPGLKNQAPLPVAFFSPRRCTFSAWLSGSSEGRLGHEWATESCSPGQRNAGAGPRSVLRGRVIQIRFRAPHAVAT